jgi:photosystem II stability/assembly factor-like uncharacterized protein
MSSTKPILILFLVLITNVLSQDLNWIAVNNGLTQSNIRSIVVTPNNYIFAATDSGIFRSTDYGLNWNKVVNGHPTEYVNSLYASNSGIVYSACEGGPVYRSTDYGLNWNRINPGLGNLSAYSVTVNSLGYIYIGSSGTGVYRSSDDGSSWQNINTGFQYTDVYINSLLTADSDVLIAGTGNEGLYRSTDSGNNWTQVYPNQPVLYLGRNTLNNIIFACLTNGVLKSTDNGLTWNYYNNGLAFTYVNGIAFNSLNESFAATYGGGVFKSTDDGNFWTVQNSGLIPTNVWSLATTSNGYLFAGSSTDGVYRTEYSTTSLETENLELNSFSLSQNYPNPFNPSTTIKYSIPNVISNGGKNLNVTLKVYDILGNEVAILVDEYKTTGSFEIDIDGSLLTSGVYFYQLRAAQYVATKKMIFMK